VQNAGPVSDFAVAITERDGGATVRFDENSDNQANAVATGQTDVGGIAIRVDGNAAGVVPTNMWRYTAALVASQRNLRTAAAFQNWSGVAMYLWIVAVGTTNVGSVDVTRLDLINLRLSGW